MGECIGGGKMKKKGGKDCCDSMISNVYEGIHYTRG